MGPTLVLIHAFPMDREMWKPQMDAWNDKFAVVTLDLPGFGSSQLPANGCSIEQMADAVIEGLNQLRMEKAVVGGLSMGGYVALAVARRKPDWLNGLILADTRPEADDDTAKANREKAITLVKEQGVKALLDQMVPKLLGTTTQKEQPQVADAVRQIGLRQSIEGVVNALTALRDRPDARPGLFEINVPTLILVGEEDVVTPPNLSQAMAGQIAGAKMMTIPEAGHLSNLEQPAAFNEAIEQFMKQISPT